MKPRASIRRRLIRITMTACGAALLLAGGGFVWVDYSSSYRAAVARLESLTQIVAHQITAALAFNDEKAAAEILRALSNEPHIFRARLRDRQGKTFALYEGPGANPYPPCVGEERGYGPHAFPGTLAVMQPVVSEGERLGIICVHADLREIRDRTRTNLQILGGLLALSLLAAFGLVSRMERRITKPILQLADTVRAVTERRDYAIRAIPAERDETGLLVEGFNEMLAQIQARDAQLEAARLDLERRVEERTRDLKTKEQQLIQAQKMEAVGRLAGGVAHDFNNMLTGILGFAEMAAQHTPPENPNHEYLKEIVGAARRAKSLTAQLLAFSRRQMLRPEIVDLNALVGETTGMLRRLLGEGIRLELDLAPAPGYILADPGQIEQVILNLAINARDAMAGKGVLTLRTTAVSLHDPLSWRDETVPPGEYLTLSVTDTGPGLAPEAQAHLFEPFFTTKAKGEGTGLGLSTVYGIVKQSGGYLTVKSSPGDGATFTIFLPKAVPRETKTEVRKPSEPNLRIHRGTVLLAEDELVVRKLAKEVLRHQGFSVIEAADGREALKLFEADPNRFDLMISDVMMPIMDGRELSRRASEIRPALKILFMSGYTDDTTFRHHLKDRKIHFLAKPFTPACLAAKVNEVMGNIGTENAEVSDETRFDPGR